MNLNKDLVAASAAPLILSLLEEGESYGYAIVQRVRELSDGEIEWTDNPRLAAVARSNPR